MNLNDSPAVVIDELLTIFRLMTAWLPMNEQMNFVLADVINEFLLSFE